MVLDRDSRRHQRHGLNRRLVAAGLQRRRLELYDGRLLDLPSHNRATLFVAQAHAQVLLIDRVQPLIELRGAGDHPLPAHYGSAAFITEADIDVFLVDAIELNRIDPPEQRGDTHAGNHALLQRHGGGFALARHVHVAWTNAADGTLHVGGGLVPDAEPGDFREGAGRTAHFDPAAVERQRI